MKKTSFSLDGTWTASTLTPEGRHLTVPARVPGMIHLDLEREGIIPPMFWRDNAEKCQWVEHCHWRYTRTFDLPSGFDPSRAELLFEGLDTWAEITLNGTLIGKSETMFAPYRFPVASLLKEKDNTLEIDFIPYQEMIVGKPLHFPAAFNRSDRVHVRRMQCTFYWDWVNRFITFGPWRSVKLISYPAGHIESLFAYTHDIARSSASINLHLNTDAAQERAIAAADLVITDPKGVAVWEERRFGIIDRHMRLQADIRSPLLWWPVGYGDQPLYTATLTLYDAAGEVLDEASTRFGIRTVRIEQLKDIPHSKEHEMTLALRGENDRAGERVGTSFLLLINGERIFCKGGNWVPADPFPCRVTKEKYRHLVALAADAGLNLLRVWGGGIYESQDFYDACDEMGVMVSQDFMLACAEFPEQDPDFLRKIAYETPLAITALRNHPAIVWWAGDNENAMHYDWDDPRAPGVTLMREVFYPALDRLDPSRPFRPTSPYGGLNNCSPTVGDCHMSNFGDLTRDYRESAGNLGRFASESVFFGSPLLTSLRKFMTEEDIADPTGAMYEYHVKDNPHKPEGAPTLYGGMRIMSEAIMGIPHTPYDRVMRDAYLQYEWARVSMEGARRRKWFTAGLQYWMYNDCWPAVGLSTVDYFGIPKPAYYALKRAARPIIASIGKENGAFVFELLNDSLKTASGTVHIYALSLFPRSLPRPLYDGAFTAAANENTRLLTLTKEACALRHGEILVCELNGDVTDRAVWRDAPGDLPLPMPRYEVERNMAQSTVTVTAKTYILALIFDGEALPEDNYLELFPGQSVTVSFRCPANTTVESVEIRALGENFGKNS